MLGCFKSCESAAIFAKACFGHPSPSKRQKLRGNQYLRRPQPSCFIRWIPTKGYPTNEAGLDAMSESLHFHYAKSAS
jgi:hypothetical protein